jgi:hypothetical protein
MDLETKKRSCTVQEHWNTDLTTAERSELLARFEGRLTRLFRTLGLTAICNDCFCLFAPCELDHDDNGWGCLECGSTDVESPGGNPTRRHGSQD